MADIDNDAELMLRVKDGDEAAFELLVHKHQKRVINTVYRFLGSTGEAEDLAQDVFLSLYRAAPRYEPRARFTTFLYRLVANRCINHARRRKVLRFLRLSSPQSRAEIGAVRLDPVDPAARPEELAERRQLAGTVTRALAALPERQRLAIILRHYQEMSYEEISTVLSLSVSSVKSSLHRARLALRDALQGVAR
jgi:RNA polymerase sigma-70 factor (ECF subfamily)